jgi:hypothetical protein
MSSIIGAHHHVEQAFSLNSALGVRFAAFTILVLVSVGLFSPVVRPHPVAGALCAQQKHMAARLGPSCTVVCTVRLGEAQ